ncbi:MAG: hypothetical protein IPG50_09070 [Myxococcales bacterium]|nr:hypothetical protein [Myxococcales bacterium]
MRLGLLGPVRDEASSLEPAVEFLLHEESVGRVIYLGNDDALDRCVEARARKLVGEDPTDKGTWRRAVDLISNGAPSEIDAFVARERERRQLRRFESLPRPALRTVEMIGDRLSVLIFDKSMLDEEDIFPAALLFYGKSPGFLAKRIGTRWFVTPGTPSAEAGIVILEESGEDLVARFHSETGNALAVERLPLAAAAKLKVQGGA